MWPWLIAGAVVLWLLSANRSSVGQTTIPQLPGAAGIVQTLGLMQTMVNNSIAHPLIRQQAARATEGVSRSDKKGAAVAIGEFVRARMRYLPDPLHHEHLTSPDKVAVAIDQGMRVFGDCDDMSMYVAALAKSIGMQPTFHAVGRGGAFHHVYTEVAGVPIDPTVTMGIKPFDPSRALSLVV